MPVLGVESSSKESSSHLTEQHYNTALVLQIRYCESHLNYPSNSKQSFLVPGTVILLYSFCTCTPPCLYNVYFQQAFEIIHLLLAFTPCKCYYFSSLSLCIIFLTLTPVKIFPLLTSLGISGHRWAHSHACMHFIHTHKRKNK